MNLTQELLDRFAGGQFEVRNEAECYLYRGLIETASIKTFGDKTWLELVTTCWAELREGAWQRCDEPSYCSNLELIRVHPDSDDQIRIFNQSDLETVTLFTPGILGPFDPADVVDAASAPAA